MFKSSSALNLGLILSLAVSASLLSSGCAGKKKAADESVSSTVGADENLMGDSDSGKAGGLRTVNFPYDSFTLDDSARKLLDANSALLKTKGNVNIQVEGHCDERGGIQYNIALAEKRANAVKKYLVDGGIKGARISTISFGKERPLNPGHDEAAWAQNRRANFVITTQ